ncbi:hypothetical protein F4810DRAFT_662729 [Camillea tinctor]|nr:hypothetical protein F4810DRAFT_662729 [Camillea tinctor]
MLNLQPNFIFRNNEQTKPAVEMFNYVRETKIASRSLILRGISTHVRSYPRAKQYHQVGYVEVGPFPFAPSGTWGGCPVERKGYDEQRGLEELRPTE